MSGFVIAFNGGKSPVLVGPMYINPGQRRRVLRQHYEEAKQSHPSLILPDDLKTRPLEDTSPKDDASLKDKVASPPEATDDAPPSDASEEAIETPKKTRRGKK